MQKYTILPILPSIWAKNLCFCLKMYRKIAQRQ